MALIGSLKLSKVSFGKVYRLGFIVAEDGLEELGVAGLDNQRGLGLKGLAAVL